MVARIDVRETVVGGYYVTSAGRVFRIGSKRALRYTFGEHGHLKVQIRGRKYQVARLVLMAFVGDAPSTKHVARHFPDRDVRNNSVANLAWGLPAENEADKKIHGTHRGGGRHWRPNASTVKLVRALVEFGASYSMVGKMTNMHRSSVSRIVRGLRRADVR